MIFAWIVAALTAYLLGNLNGSVSISALVEKDDVRRHGSGNAGLTNFFRNYGGWDTLLVMLVDVLKTAMACFAAGYILSPYGYYREGLMLGAVCVTLGHDFPVLLGFKGGKGILCGVTIAMVVDWRTGLIITAVFLLAFAVTRYVSLGSVLAAIAFGVCFVVFQRDSVPVMLGGLVLAALALFMHRGNICRLVKGTESKVHLIHRDLNKK